MKKHLIVIIILAGVLATFMNAARMKPGGPVSIPPISDAILIVGVIYGVGYLVIKFIKKIKKGRDPEKPEE